MAVNPKPNSGEVFLIEQIELCVSPVVHKQFQPIGMKESKDQLLLHQLVGRQEKANEKPEIITD